MISGSRYLNNRSEPVIKLLLVTLQPDVLIHGDCRGADRLAARLAKELGIEVRAYPADWNQGPSAGPRRNQRMLDLESPDLVIAIHTDPLLGDGTRDMVKRAVQARVRHEILILPPDYADDP